MIDDEWLDPHYLYLLMSIFWFIHWVSFLRILFIVETGCSMACQKGKHNHGALWLIMDLHIIIYSIMELHIIRFMKIHNAQFHSWSSTICCYMEPQTICGDPSSTWWSSIIYILWSSMIEMSTEFHNKLGSSIIMIFVFSGTLCDYGKVKRTRAYRLLNHVVFDCKK